MKVWRKAAGTRPAPDSGDSLITHWRVDMSAVPLLLIDGYALPVTVRLHVEHVT
jgi:hypothetical protein